MKKLRYLLPFLLKMGYAQNGKTLIQLTDLLKIKTVGSVAVSADGSKAAYSVTTIEPEAANPQNHQYITQLYVVNTDGSNARQLTYAKEGASQPAFSPDGRQLAFVRVAEGKPQLFLLPTDGGEAKQLTNNRYGASSPRWSADGRQLLYTANITLANLLTDTLLNPTKEIPQWPFEKPGFAKNENLKPNTAQPNANGSLQEIRSYLQANENEKIAKVITTLQFQEESTTSSTISFTHLFLADVASGNSKPITHGFFSYTNPRFVGNTSQIIFETNQNENQHPHRSQQTEIWMINTNGSGLKKILGKEGMAFTSPTPSASGKWVAFMYAKTETVTIPALAIMPINGTEKTMITIPWDRNKANMLWADDEKYLWFTSQQNGGNVLCRMDIKTKKAEAITDASSGILSMDGHNNKMVYGQTAITNPSELFTLSPSAKGKQPEAMQLSFLNTPWLQNVQLSLPEKKTLVNNQKKTVSYWVMKPTQYTNGKKYPLLLEMHGGPAAMWGPGEASMWHEYQYFCAKGYGLVYANPRGSAGYGEAFLKDNINDWGAGPSSDVLAAMDGAIAEGWADTSRLILTGGSYAGYLTAWIVGHTNRFKAACAQRGVYDLSTFFGEGNAWRLVPNYFGGYPWQASTQAILERESPINYVQNVQTPLIIFHGENDLRTGVIQGEQFYKSLKVLGKPVEYVRHPGATHEITRSGNNRQRLDQMLRTYEFFERYIGRN